MDLVSVAARDDGSADFVVVVLIVRVFRCLRSRHLPRFMRVVRSGRAVVPVFLFLFLADFGYVSFCLAEFSVELVFVCPAFFCVVPFSVAPLALLRVGGRRVLVLFPILFVGVDHHGSVVGGRSSLVHFCHILELLPGEFICFNLRKPLR